MKPSSKKHDHFYINRKLVATVVILLIIGSGLVVLTNTAINFMSASRDYTALIATWNQANQNKFQRFTKYMQSGGLQNRNKFIDAKSRALDIRELINQLFKTDSKNKNVIAGFSRINMKPTKVANLITAFQYLQNLNSFRYLHASWSRLDAVNKNVDQLATSSIQLYNSQQNSAVADKLALQQRISRLENISAELTTRHLKDVARISDWINRFALWITVILGLLLVLAGIVFSVKGWKSINKWEETLKERNYLASFPELNPNPVLQVNRDGTLNYTNPAAQNYFPNLEKEKINHPFLKGIINYFKEKALSEDKKYQQVVKINRRHFLQSIHYIANEDGLHIHAQNITEKINQEKKIRRSLKEKEVLLSEIHHRVKNNLAVISGLLQIQSMNGIDPEKALKKSQMRIQSMAMIHEIMYEAESFSKIDFNNYVNRLIEKNHKSHPHLPNSYRIRLHAETDDVYLNINQAIPGGLILNELLSNSMEHAFEDGQKGEIVVKLTQKGETVRLTVKDNGKGLPENFSLSDIGSTGLTIVQALTIQLDAKLTIHERPGAEFSILFQKSDAAGSSNARL